MKKADLKTLKVKSIEDLTVLFEKACKELRKMKLEKYTEGHTNTQIVKAKKKEIARILTIITEKRIIQNLEKMEQQSLEKEGKQK